MKNILLLLLSLIVAFPALAELPLGITPISVTLAGDDGGRLDGTPWSSDELRGSLHLMFYVDPDEADTNNAASEAVKAQKFPKDRLRSVAIVNMDATWKPDFAIEMALEKKQKAYPDTTYVKDMEKKLVGEWKISDDSSNVVLFGIDGKVLFSKDGKLSSEEIEKLLQTIRENL